MYLCYIDESGTPDLPGNTSHYVLAGLSIPIWKWKSCDWEIFAIKRKYALEKCEMHVAWLLRAYIEQTRIPNFENLSYKDRFSQVQALRKAELFRLQRSKNPKLYHQTRKNYRKTEGYIHLTFDERKNFIKEVTQCISSWSFIRLFAECINKIYFDPTRVKHTIDEQAFEQIVSRFEKYIQIVGRPGEYGMLIHDNNDTVARRHTELMKRFHNSGTLWTTIERIIETPLFVDSELTSLIQLSDLCSYALRRYLENGETELFNLIYQRADRKGNTVVGVRHFSNPSCSCEICDSRRPTSGNLALPPSP